MAPSHASLLAAACSFAAVATALAVEPHGPQIDDSAPIQLEAGPSNFDYKNSRLVFHSVRISQGGIAIEADEGTATGLDFKESKWLFTGHVRITVPDGSLQSDEARILFAANLISSADISGSPARFEQKGDRSIARGRATHIIYQPGPGTLKLVEDAWLSDGNNEISGQSLVYNIREQRVIASPDEQGVDRIRITINPKKPEPKTNP
jgi:lipopolysaccharide export system protein LptA